MRFLRFFQPKIDALMKKLSEEFPRDLQLKDELEGNCPIVPSKLAQMIPPMITRFKKWVKKLENKVKSSKRTLVLDNGKYIDDDVEIPGESLNPQEPKTYIRVFKLLANVKVVDLFDSMGKEISFLGTNGRIYKFLSMTNSMAGCG